MGKMIWADRVGNEEALHREKRGQEYLAFNEKKEG
jgi:hypothetical protein